MWGRGSGSAFQDTSESHAGYLWQPTCEPRGNANTVAMAGGSGIQGARSLVAVARKLDLPMHTYQSNGSSIKLPEPDTDNNPYLAGIDASSMPGFLKTAAHLDTNSRNCIEKNNSQASFQPKRPISGRSSSHARAVLPLPSDENMDFPRGLLVDMCTPRDIGILSPLRLKVSQGHAYNGAALPASFRPSILLPKTASDYNNGNEYACVAQNRPLSNASSVNTAARMTFQENAKDRAITSKLPYQVSSNVNIPAGCGLLVKHHLPSYRREQDGLLAVDATNVYQGLDGQRQREVIAWGFQPGQSQRTAHLNTVDWRLELRPHSDLYQQEQGHIFAQQRVQDGEQLRHCKSYTGTNHRKTSTKPMTWLDDDAALSQLSQADTMRELSPIPVPLHDAQCKATHPQTSSHDFHRSHNIVYTPMSLSSTHMQAPALRHPPRRCESAAATSISIEGVVGLQRLISMAANHSKDSDSERSRGPGWLPIECGKVTPSEDTHGNSMKKAKPKTKKCLKPLPSRRRKDTDSHSDAGACSSYGCMEQCGTEDLGDSQSDCTHLDNDSQYTSAASRTSSVPTSMSHSLPDVLFRHESSLSCNISAENPPPEDPMGTQRHRQGPSGACLDAITCFSACSARALDRSEYTMTRAHAHTAARPPKKMLGQPHLTSESILERAEAISRLSRTNKKVASPRSRSDGTAASLEIGRHTQPALPHRAHTHTCSPSSSMPKAVPLKVTPRIAADSPKSAEIQSRRTSAAPDLSLGRPSSGVFRWKDSPLGMTLKGKQTAAAVLIQCAVRSKSARSCVLHVRAAQSSRAQYSAVLVLQKFAMMVAQKRRPGVVQKCAAAIIVSLFRRAIALKRVRARRLSAVLNTLDANINRINNLLQIELAPCPSTGALQPSHLAACTLQRAVRCMRARRHAATLKMLAWARFAVRIQAALRGHVVRCMMRDYASGEARRGAALRVQAVWRGHIGRKCAAELVARRYVLLEMGRVRDAVVILQAVARRHAVLHKMGRVSDTVVILQAVARRRAVLLHLPLFGEKGPSSTENTTPRSLLTKDTFHVDGDEYEPWAQTDVQNVSERPCVSSDGSIKLSSGDTVRLQIERLRLSGDERVEAAIQSCACSCIQSIWRGHVARKWMKAAYSFLAALRLQRVYRGHLGRKIARTLTQRRLLVPSVLEEDFQHTTHAGADAKISAFASIRSDLRPTWMSRGRAVTRVS